MAVQVYQFPDYARVQLGLIDFATTLQKTWPNSKLGVMTHGWSSPKGDWEGSWICPELLEIKKFFCEKIPSGAWDLVAWFNILEPGGTIAEHTHWQADYACAYHVSGDGGLLVNLGYKSEMIPARPGRLAVFAGTVRHSVPQPCSGIRFSISINAHRRKL